MNDIQRPAEYSDIPIYDVRDILKDGQIAHIVHDGQLYVLRVTKSGKLIMTK